MERTKAYRTILKLGILVCIFATLFFVAMLYSDNFWPLLLSFAVLGMYNELILESIVFTTTTSLIITTVLIIILLLLFRQVSSFYLCYL